MNYPKNLETALNWNYKFWDKQPVPKLNEKIMIEGPIEEKKEEIENNHKELPKEFEWVSIDLMNDENRKEVVDLLDKYYVEDPNHEFRLHYSSDFLKWIYEKNYHLGIGIRVKQNKVLVAFISGKIIKMQINRSKLDLAEINFLCVHPKLRDKRLTPVLIKEITRQFNLLGYFQAQFTNSNYLPSPICTVKYFHRPINIKKLVETGFTILQGKLTIKEVKKTHKIDEVIQIKNFVKIEKRHIDQSFELFHQYMNKYNYHPIFSKEEFEHIFLNNKFVVCYVIEDDKGNVMDFASYYVSQSKILKRNEKYKFINKANLFYYTCSTETAYKLIKNLLIIAKKNNVDVFDALDIMENSNILKELHFGEGTGILNYNLFNWKMRPIKNMQVATIMI